jgi:hypothetical protein
MDEPYSSYEQRKGYQLMRDLMGSDALGLRGR